MNNQTNWDEKAIKDGFQELQSFLFEHGHVIGLDLLMSDHILAAINIAESVCLGKKEHLKQVMWADEYLSTIILWLNDHYRSHVAGVAENDYREYVSLLWHAKAMLRERWSYVKPSDVIVSPQESEGNYDFSRGLCMTPSLRRVFKEHTIDVICYAMDQILALEHPDRMQVVTYDGKTLWMIADSEIGDVFDDPDFVPHVTCLLPEDY